MCEDTFMIVISLFQRVFHWTHIHFFLSVNEALQLAKEYIRISANKMNINKLCIISLLYHNEELWIKKRVSRNVDNPMGSYDYVFISELVGCLVLYKLNDIIDSGCRELYRDDVLIIIDNCTPRKWDIIWKKLHSLFNNFRFMLNIQVNLKTTVSRFRPGECPGACSGLRSGAWPWKRNNGRLGAFN